MKVRDGRPADGEGAGARARPGDAVRAGDSVLGVFERCSAVRSLAGALERGERSAALGSAGSSTSFVAGAVARLTGRLVVLAVAHLDEADESVDELGAAGVPARRLPALELAAGEDALSLDLFAERLAVLREAVSAGESGGSVAGGRVLACPIQALMQGAPSPARMDELMLALEPGDGRGPEFVARWLSVAGYERLDSIEEPGDFAVRGGIIDVFPASSGGGVGGALRLDFFGDELESITEIDLATMGSDRRLARAEVIGASLAAVTSEAGVVNPLELLPRGALALLSETAEATEQARGYYERVTDARGVWGPPAVVKLLRERFAGFAEVNRFSSVESSVSGEVPARPLPEFSRDSAEAVAELGAMSSSGRVIARCQNEGERSRLTELLGEFAAGSAVEVELGYVHRGFVLEEVEGAVSVVPHHELFHRFHARRRVRRLRGGRASESFLSVSPGDYVVHQDHGIAKFVGLKVMKPRRVKGTASEEAEAKLRRAAGEEASGGAAPEEYLTLEFAGRAKLHVPVAQIERVQRYVGGHHGAPPLSGLGGKRWQAQKEKVEESVRDLAAELLRVQAAREHMPGVRYPSDTPWQREFEAEFPYDETEDQLAALGEIKGDMQSARPMDRLLCGDVGYGKTELAIRAAFKAVEFGKQAAVLVPTTLLAEQHGRTFAERFSGYPFVVESLSRFKSRREQNDVLMRTRKGQVDVLIGTHRLLSKDVKFADLGVVVVDEEQRFGVEHKQALLALRMTADVLTLTATPIPRTLHMSMLGLRDISSLSTPPLDRRAVVTEVLPYNETRLRRAIERELSREGQVYVVHDRVHSIQSFADDIQRLAPGARIVIGHGQMPTEELERVMGAFVRREADILVSTTIIESGIDIPTANTMIIHNADRFGLADLHQLRGRVGRYKHRAYCYLLLPGDRPVTEVAARRLRAIEEFSMLGAGFKIAMRDLEIRGAGNLLGAEQSGHIAAVGYDLYCRLLERASRELRQEPTAEAGETSVEIGVSGLLPRGYIPSEARRIEAYRRIASAATAAELEKVTSDLTDAYGEPPEQAQRLIELASVRVGAAALGVRSVARRERDVVIRCEDPARVERAFAGVRGSVRAVGSEVYFRPPESFLEPATLLAVLRRRFSAGQPV